jgi:hypothetical protein
MSGYSVSSLIEQWLSEDIDQWTRRMVCRHFDPVTGSPYWLRRTAALSFDPRDITSYEELSAFGLFPLDELRTVDPADLVPLDRPRPLPGRIWESDGTTGEPCRIYCGESMLEHCLAWRRWADERDGFEPGKNWLLATPTGPHITSHWARGLTEFQDARVYGIDFDPRWLKRQLRAGKMQDAMQYTEHIVDQIIVILTTQPVDYICTTPALLRAVSRREPDRVAQLKGARLSGTHITPEIWRILAKALNGGLLGIDYGNTFGNAPALSVLEEGELIAYIPNYPHVTVAVVDTSDWTRVADYGKDGQVRLTVMHEDLFLPNILERDLATRYDTRDEWPCDGLANVRPLPERNNTRSPSAYAQIRLAQLRRSRAQGA